MMTFSPFRGEVSPAPCTSGMVLATGVPGGGVVPAPGVGVPAVKSAALLAALVLVLLREADVEFDGAGVARAAAAAPVPAAPLVAVVPSTLAATPGGLVSDPMAAPTTIRPPAGIVP